MNLAALFAIQGNSVPFLGTSIAHVILCLRSRMTNTRDTCSSDSLSPRNPQSIDSCSRSSCASDLLCDAFTPRPITQNLHHDLYGRCVVMCSWCSLTVGWPGSRMFLTCTPSNPISPSSMSSSSVSPFNSTSFSSFVAHSTLSHSRCLSQRPSTCGLTVSVRSDLSSSLTPHAVKKLGCCNGT